MSIREIVHRLTFLPIFAAVVAAGCDDDLGPQTWDATPDTVELFSLDRVEYVGLPSAFDIVGGSHSPKVVEQAGSTDSWDFVLREGETTLLLTPASAFVGIDSRAGIAVVEGTTFESLARAPSDTILYSRTESVPVAAGGVYVVRSRRYATLGATCVSYAKLTPVEIDVVEGTLRFAVVGSPYCNDRSFVPPQ